MPISPSFASRLDPIVADLAAARGTPFFIYDEAGIVATHRTMSAAFGDWPYRQYFAVKALPNPWILRSLAEEGSGLDCSSPVELRLAQSAGARGRDIVFTSNNTSPQEYEEALRAGALVTFDDAHYLHRATVLPECVAFRVAPAPGANGSPLMGGAGDSKFGVPSEQLVEAYREAMRRGARRFGIHGMSYANELDVGRAIEAVHGLVASALQVSDALGLSFDYVNFGGGIGIPYRPGEAAFDFEAFAAAIRTALAAAFPDRRVAALTECGRFVTGPHGILVTGVVNRVRKGREIAGLDASLSAMIRPALYPNAWHHISLPLAGQRRPVELDVVGSMCENGDRFATARMLPDAREGDILYIHDAGAHAHAMGLSYNGRLRPAELLMKADGSIVEIRRAERFDDHVATVRTEPLPIETGSTATILGPAEREALA